MHVLQMFEIHKNIVPQNERIQAWAVAGLDRYTG